MIELARLINLTIRFERFKARHKLVIHGDDTGARRRFVAGKPPSFSRW